MAPGIPNIFSNLETGKVTNNELLDTSQSSAFESLGLSRTQRMYGFIACLITGLIVSLLGAVLFFTGRTTTFAFLYVIGIIISLVGTGFLIGFGRQLSQMFKPVRVAATLVFLGSIVMVFISAFWLDIDALVMIFAVTTYLAYTWYGLSYIPWARSFVKKLFGIS